MSKREILAFEELTVCLVDSSQSVVILSPCLLVYWLLASLIGAKTSSIFSYIYHLLCYWHREFS